MEPNPMTTQTLTRAVAGAALLALLSLLLDACQSDQGTPGRATATVTVTATPTSDATTAPTVAYDDVVAYANEHGFPEIPAAMGATLGQLCDALEGRNLDTAWGQRYRNGFVNSAAGDGLWTKKETAVLFGVLVDGCVKTGHTTLWAPPDPLSHDDVILYLRQHGYPRIQRYDADLNSSIAESCRAINHSKPGTYLVRNDRLAWWKALRGDHTRAEADDFINALYEACYATGHAKRWTPPPPRTSFDDGTWRVGTDIAAGSYRIASANDYCLYYRLNKMTSATDPGAIISWGWANAGDPVLATIEPGDVAFQSMGCGTWHKIS